MKSPENTLSSLGRYTNERQSKHADGTAPLHWACLGGFSGRVPLVEILSLRAANISRPCRTLPLAGSHCAAASEAELAEAHVHPGWEGHRQVGWRHSNRVKCPSSLPRSNQYEGPGNAFNPNGGGREQEKECTLPGHTYPTFLGKSGNSACPNQQPLTD